MYRSKLTLFLLLLAASLSGFAQAQNRSYPQRDPVRVLPPYAQASQSMDALRSAAGHYAGSSPDTAFIFTYGQSVSVFLPAQTNQDALSHASEYDDYLERKRRHEAAQAAELLEIQQHADPEAPDQSEQLKNSKDHDLILRYFRTMYVDAHDAKFFDSNQMKAALGRNKEFQKLNIRMVDDPRMADVVLKVSYTFAWDFPFELRHQNTTYVLLAGKGEGPLSGPLGAADVAREFVKAARPWRERK